MLAGQNSPPSEHAPPTEAAALVDDAARSSLYALLAKLLSDVPDGALLRIAAELRADPTTPVGAALSDLAAVARDHRDQLDVLSDEFHDLFLGVGRGELLPYASYYLTGFLHEKPLAELREQLQALGLTADPDEKEPEDHIAAVLDVMAHLTRPDSGDPAAARQFFDRQVVTWAPKFFADLQAADRSAFYAPVGRLGSAFLDVEVKANAMA
ncbi:MAG: molecular chaperone TorD family protein [Pseudomonadota bacterium]